MGRRTRVEEFCMNSEAARRLQVAPQGCGTCWGLLHYKDKPCTRPAVPYTRLQEWEAHEWLSLCDNDCSTQRRGNGQRSLLWMGSIECMYVRESERVHWEITQECEDTCQRQRIWVTFNGTLPFSPPLKKYHNPIKRLGLWATLDGTNGSLVHWLKSVGGV